MTLNRADFPEMTDEQWNAIVAENDRRATEASKTARDNAAREQQKAIQDAVTAALDAERARLEMDEQQKLEADRKALADQQAAIAAERRSLAATKKLTAAGFAEDKIDSLLPMFSNVADDALDTVLDSFVANVTETVKTQVDSAKKELLNAATPPNDPTAAPVSPNAAAQQLIDTGDAVGAAEMLLKDAGLVA